MYKIYKSIKLTELRMHNTSTNSTKTRQKRTEHFEERNTHTKKKKNERRKWAHLLPQALHHRNLQPQHPPSRRRRILATPGGMLQEGRDKRQKRL